MGKSDILRFLVEELCYLWDPEDLDKIGESLKKVYGPIHKSAPAKIHDIEGFLIWDFIVWNEITFKSLDETTIVSLYTSTSDEKTEERWGKLVDKYGV